MSTDPALQAFLAEQAADYRRSLPARLAALDAAWAAIESGPAQSAAAQQGLDALLRLSHGLGGSAGTFGLPRLGARARWLESACERALVAARSSPPAPDWPARLAAPVAGLRRVLLASQAGP